MSICSAKFIQQNSFFQTDLGRASYYHINRFVTEVVSEFVRKLVPNDLDELTRTGIVPANFEQRRDYERVAVKLMFLHDKILLKLEAMILEFLINPQSDT